MLYWPSLDKGARSLGKGSLTCSLCDIGVMCDRAGGSGPRRHAVWPAWQDSTDLSLEFRDVATDSLPVNFSKGQRLVCLPPI